MERERGQVLPLYIFGILGLLMFVFFIIDYANVVRWQIRAQNAADAAAQSILALQTQEFNQMNILLYASAIEEFRVRRLLNSMLLSAHLQGGCNDTGSCDVAYANARNEYLHSVQRYTNDVVTFNKLAANINLTTTAADAHALISTLTTGTSCTDETGGDCSFQYQILDISARTGLEDVRMDALSILKPSFNQSTGPATVNSGLFAPARVEVAVCARIPPIMNGFFNFIPLPFYAVGRSAATAVMVEQDWLQPGQIVNAVGGGVFQPAETVSNDSSSSYNWYNVDFGGNSTQAFGTAYNVFESQVTSDEFSARLGWWNSVPIMPYTGGQTVGSVGCQQAVTP